MADGRADAERDMHWVTTRLRSFAPWAAVPGSYRASRHRSRLKPFGELAMIHGCLAEWHARITPRWPQLDESLARWREFLLACCADERYLGSARDDRENGLYRMQPYAWLRATGARIPAAEEVVRGLWLAGCQPTSIGQVHSLARGGFVGEVPRWDDFCRRQLLEPLWSDEALDREAYRITHAVFYATDLGGRKTGLTDEERSSAAVIVYRVAARAWRARQWDRLLEAIIAARSLGQCVAPFVGARAEARRAQFADGALPQHAAVRGGRFVSCYHATLVSLLDGVQHELHRD